MAAGKTDGDDVLGPVHETAVQQAGQLAADRDRKQLFVQVGQGLVRRQVRLGQKPSDPPPLPFLVLGLAQEGQQPPITPVLGFGLGHGLFGQLRHGRQAETAQVHRHTFTHGRASSSLES